MKRLDNVLMFLALYKFNLLLFYYYYNYSAQVRGSSLEGALQYGYHAGAHKTHVVGAAVRENSWKIGKKDNYTMSFF